MNSSARRRRPQHLVDLGGDKLKLVMHVGPHKTGTTSLQKALLKQYGSETPQPIWFPIPAERRFGTGHAVAAWKMLGRHGQPCLPGDAGSGPAVAVWEMLGRGQPRSQLVEQAEKTSACRCLILSSEIFEHSFESNMEFLIEETLGTDMHIIVTLSSVGRRGVSMWQEMVKHRSLLSLDDARDVVLQFPGFSPLYVRFFADHFPEAKVSVVIADRKAPESLFKLFGEATGIPLATPGTAKELVANRSLGLIETKILSSFNAGVKNTSLTDENYKKARQLLGKQLRSDEWRAVVPMIPIAPPEDWVSPLRERCIATVADLKELEAQGRIAIFGDLESLDDLRSETDREQHG